MCDFAQRLGIDPQRPRHLCLTGLPAKRSRRLGTLSVCPPALPSVPRRDGRPSRGQGSSPSLTRTRARNGHTRSPTAGPDRTRPDTLSYSNPEELRVRIAGLAKAAGLDAVSSPLPEARERSDERRPARARAYHCLEGRAGETTGMCRPGGPRRWRRRPASRRSQVRGR
jgi:hypothetical protein